MPVVVGATLAMALTASFSGLQPLAVGAQAAGDDLEAAVKRTGQQLRQSWGADPSTASLPFPAIDLLAAGTGVRKACGGSDPPDDPGSAGIYCPGSARVLLDRMLLKRRVEQYGDSAIAYWIGTALAERFLSGQRGTASLPPAAANLQANCLAGVLIGAAPGRKPVEAQARLEWGPAMAAYNSSQAERMGTRPQRAYALLTGFGATESSCSDADMAALASGRVPDPALLDQLEQVKDERASSSLMAVIASRCRPRPQRSCPRQIRPMKWALSGAPTPTPRGR
ncbi:hypothetical protein [Cyanobium sp. N5-Cardenillas]|uniref:hypothetical protein n=1 Tax=Cyanobium sp. N5-Cardenillas TaxID=2823720 RepID=UPI0020CD7F66|nr:hypothetical protein [Cyanobium sp. N5-Cardenillas]